MSTVRPHTIQRRHTPFPWPFQSSARRTPFRIRVNCAPTLCTWLAAVCAPTSSRSPSAVKPQRAMQIGMCPRELPAHKAAAYPQRVVEQSEVGIGAVAEPALLRETEQLRRV